MIDDNPLSPDFADALWRGLGRAIGMLAANPTPDKIEALRDAIFEPGGYPFWHDRSQYLSDLVDAAPDPAALVPAVIDALIDSEMPAEYAAPLVELRLKTASPDDYAILADALDGFARHQIAAGKFHFTDGLFAWVSWRGAVAWNEILEAFQKRGLPDDELDRLSDIYDALRRRDGIRAARRANLTPAAKDVFAAFLRERRHENSQRRAFQKRRDVPSTLADVRKLLVRKPKTYPWQLQSAAARLLGDDFSRLARWDSEIAHDPKRLARWLHCFTKRPFPENPDRLRAFLFSPDEHVAAAAIGALSKIPRFIDGLRADAFALAARGDDFPCRHALPSLLIHARGEGEGDETESDALVATIVSETFSSEPDVCHRIKFGLFDYVESSPSVRLAPLVADYAVVTGCDFCRERALKWLIERGVAPDALLCECLRDAGENVRALARAEITRRGAAAIPSTF